MNRADRQLAQYLARELREAQTTPLDLEHEFRAERVLTAMERAADLLDRLAQEAADGDASDDTY